MEIEILFRKDYTSSPFHEKLCALIGINGNKLLLSSGSISISLFNNYNFNDKISIVGRMFKKI